MRKFISCWLSFFVLFLLENACRKKKLHHKVLVVLASKMKHKTKSLFHAVWQCFVLSCCLKWPLNLIDCRISLVWPVCFVEKAVASSLWTAKLMFGVVSSSNHLVATSSNFVNEQRRAAVHLQRWHQNCFVLCCYRATESKEWFHCR